jgi:GNAT acetyltransferase-like protein
VFHSVGWLQSLRRTYGYDPVVFTTSSPTGNLQNGLVFCRVESWLTGRRLVALPFSDHCEPLCDSDEERRFLVRYLLATVEPQHWKYLEIRPIIGDFGEMSEGAFAVASKYWLHTLSLRPSVEELLNSFDKDNVQRRIRRADSANLVEKCGRSLELLRDFYRLFVVTRARHKLPPIPQVWFRNLIECQGEALEIRIAYQKGTPIAAILTIEFRNTVYYKYGCSDVRFKQFGATPWLLWRAIRAAKLNGASTFDLGRTEVDNAGLLEFKNHWVGQPKKLFYWKFPDTVDATAGWRLSVAKRFFAHMPDPLLRLAGRLLYRHIG